jgi:hypothetical protein
MSTVYRKDTDSWHVETRARGAYIRERMAVG